MAEASAESNDHEKVDKGLPRPANSDLSQLTSADQSTATEQHLEDVAVATAKDSMIVDSPQNSDGVPHTASGLDLTQSSAFDDSIDTLDLTSDETFVPAGNPMPLEQDTQMPDISTDMADRLLRAIEADDNNTSTNVFDKSLEDIFPSGNKGSSTTAISDVSEDMEGEFPQYNERTTEVSQDPEARIAFDNTSIAGASTSSINTGDTRHIQDDNDAGSRAGTQKAQMSEENADEDFDAEAFIRDAPFSLEGLSNNGGQRGDRVERIALSGANAWMHDFNPEEDEDEDQEARRRYAHILIICPDYS